jgi:hypothetical protein
VTTTPHGFPAYFWRHKQPFVAWFCTEADAEQFLEAQEGLDEIAAVGNGPQPDVAYVNLGHYHCMADDCPEGGDDE